MRTILVLPYSADWAEAFEQIKSELSPPLGDAALSIEHVGSTAVPGLYAKPVIDIDVVIEQKMFATVKERLESMGYFHIGDLGIAGREAFKYEDKAHLMTHHLYVCDQDADELKRHIALRNFLRKNKTYREKYSEVKRAMAEKYPHDIDSYIAGKEPMIMEIYEKCGLDSTYKLNQNLPTEG